MSHDKFNLSSKKKKFLKSTFLCKIRHESLSLSKQPNTEFVRTWANSSGSKVKDIYCWRYYMYLCPGRTKSNTSTLVFKCIHSLSFASGGMFSFLLPFLILSSHLVESGGIFARGNEPRCTMCEYTGDRLVFLRTLQRKFLALCLWHGRQEIPRRPAQCNKQTSCI